MFKLAQQVEPESNPAVHARPRVPFCNWDVFLSPSLSWSEELLYLKANVRKPRPVCLESSGIS